MRKSLIRTTCLIVILALAAALCAAEESPRVLWGRQSPYGVGTVPDNLDSQDPQVSKDAKTANGFDVLRGNGSPAGYMLHHGNVVPSSVVVSIDGRQLSANREYFLDSVSGGLSFAEAIKPGESIRVSYTYVDGAAASRSLAGLPMLQDLFGGTSSASFLHAYRAADSSALPFDVLTFGMKMNFDLSSSTGLQSMYYVSDPRRGSTAASLLEKSATSSTTAAPVSDRMMVQNATINAGNSRVSLGYQDIGQNFNGFATLKEQAVLEPDAVNQLEREKGLRRLSAALELKPSNLLPEGSPWNRLGWTQVYDSAGAMQSMELVYRTATVGISGAMRSVDPTFKRLTSLSKDEQTRVALLTRQQFDLNATAGQVTDADRLAVTREAGLDRNILNTYVKLNPKVTGTLSLLGIRDTKGDISRQTFSLAAANWQGWISQQTVSSSFGKLSLLAPVETQNFGNERGLSRTSAGMSAKVLSRLALTGDYSQVEGDIGNVCKAGLGLAGKYVNFKAGYQSIDASFTRIADLADSQKNAMAADRGFTKWDVALGGQFSKALKVDTAFTRGDNPTEKLDRASNIYNILFSPSDKTKLTLQHNNALNRSAEDVLSGSLRDIQGIEQHFKNNWFVSAGRDTNLTRAAGGVEAGSVTNTRHFETDKAHPAWFSMDQRLVDYRTGAFEHTQSVNSQFMGGRALTVQMSQVNADRGTLPSEDVSKISTKWTASKALNAGLDVFQRQTNYEGDGTGYLSSLSGQVAKRFGPFSSLVLTAEYGGTNMSAGRDTFTSGGKLDWLWGKNVLGLEYSHLRLSDGQSPLARGYRLKTDQDAKKWYHLDLYVKNKVAGWGQLQPLRAINGDVRLGPSTQLAMVVNQYKELPNGQIEYTASRSTKLTTRVMHNLNLVLDMRHDQNLTAGTNTLKNSIGLQRQAAKGLVFDFAYGLDQAITPTGRVDGRSLRVHLDRQISAERYITLVGEATHWDNSNPSIPSRNTVDARLDYRVPFSL